MRFNVKSVLVGLGLFILGFALLFPTIQKNVASSQAKTGYERIIANTAIAGKSDSAKHYCEKVKSATRCGYVYVGTGSASDKSAYLSSAGLVESRLDAAGWKRFFTSQRSADHVYLDYTKKHWLGVECQVRYGSVAPGYELSCFYYPLHGLDL